MYLAIYWSFNLWVVENAELTRFHILVIYNDKYRRVSEENNAYNSRRIIDVTKSIPLFTGE